MTKKNKNDRPAVRGIKPKLKEIRGSTRPIGALEKKHEGIEGRKLTLISQQINLLVNMSYRCNRQYNHKGMP
jgi:hypothetical protein